jgi:hypothetical protein
MFKKKLTLFRFAATVLIVFAPLASARAQSPGSAAKPNTTIPEKQHMGAATAPHDGVIKPKRDADPDMTKKPPPQDPAETPVIPPSATSGGNEAK